MISTGARRGRSWRRRWAVSRRSLGVRRHPAEPRLTGGREHAGDGGRRGAGDASAAGRPDDPSHPRRPDRVRVRDRRRSAERAVAIADTASTVIGSRFESWWRWMVGDAIGQLLLSPSRADVAGRLHHVADRSAPHRDRRDVRRCRRAGDHRVSVDSPVLYVIRRSCCGSRTASGPADRAGRRDRRGRRDGGHRARGTARSPGSATIRWCRCSCSTSRSPCRRCGRRSRRPRRPRPRPPRRRPVVAARHRPGPRCRR